jgi:dTDP-glucose 4,6-dehydratase
MKILLTGGAGFIGSNFIRYVLGAGKLHSLANYDKLTYAGNLGNLESVANDPNYTFVKGDICDAQALEIAMRAATRLSILRPNLMLTAVFMSHRE